MMGSIMSDGVIIEGKRIIYGESRALLPIIEANEKIKWILWGERREGDCYPHGGWVHPTDLKARTWRPWRPKAVVIPADGFMVRKQGGKEEWFPLEDGEGIQGMMACREEDCRLYIVTTHPPEEYGWARRWPEIVKSVRDSEKSFGSVAPLRQPTMST